QSYGGHPRIFKPDCMSAMPHWLKQTVACGQRFTSRRCPKDPDSKAESEPAATARAHHPSPAPTFLTPPPTARLAEAGTATTLPAREGLAYYRIDGHCRRSSRPNTPCSVAF